jgi:uncharacterized membrane protein
MNDSLSLAPVDAAPENERTILLIAYILYALEPFTLGVTAIVGVIINHLKINDTSSMFLRSHHRWLMRTFWYTLLWSVVFGVLMVTIILIPICWAGFAILGLWHLYRIIRGGLNFFERRPMPV